MDYGKRKATPGGGGGLSDGKRGGISEAEATRTAVFLQAQLCFVPDGLTPMQAEAHRRDQLARLRLGLPLRRSADEIDERFNRPLTRAEILALEGLK